MHLEEIPIGDHPCESCWPPSVKTVYSGKSISYHHRITLRAGWSFSKTELVSEKTFKDMDEAHDAASQAVYVGAAGTGH